MNFDPSVVSREKEAHEFLRVEKQQQQLKKKKIKWFKSSLSLGSVDWRNAAAFTPAQPVLSLYSSVCCFPPALFQSSVGQLQCFQHLIPPIFFSSLKGMTRNYDRHFFGVFFNPRTGYIGRSAPLCCQWVYPTKTQMVKGRHVSFNTQDDDSHTQTAARRLSWCNNNKRDFTHPKSF